jgi:hypothetical protein
MVHQSNQYVRGPDCALTETRVSHTIPTVAFMHEMNAGLSARRADEKRKLVAQLNAEADAIDKQISEGQQSEEYKTLAGQDKYEADREKNDAKKIAESMRQLAEEEAKNAENGESTAKHFRQQAANGRATADRIRKL